MRECSSRILFGALSIAIVALPLFPSLIEACLLLVAPLFATLALPLFSSIGGTHVLRVALLFVAAYLPLFPSIVEGSHLGCGECRHGLMKTVLDEILAWHQMDHFL